MTTPAYLACDLGAESGRIVRGRLSDGRLAIDEIHRFPTGGIALGDSLRWDLPRIIDELRSGIRLAAAQGAIASISSDSWACDYVLASSQDAVLSLPYHYRDQRGDSAFSRVFPLVPPEQAYAETGILCLPFNTLYQLHWDATRRPGMLALADRFLMIADWCNWAFSGVGVAEESLASTSQLYATRTRRWSATLIRRAGLPERLFPPLVPSATVLGPALPELGAGAAQIVASCSHDTAAAVAAVPADGPGWAYLSCGTWSLLGIELAQPICTPAAATARYSNEQGLGGSIRFLNIIVGLWIVQECRRAWRVAGQDLSYAELTRLAGAAPPGAVIDVLDPRFAAPDDMPRKIASFCRETGQPVPEGIGAIVRCALESLALSYRRALDTLEGLTGQRLSRLHIVGGGTRNRLLMQLAADATGRQVIAGPVEATAIGNLLIQGMALGHVADHAALRGIVRRSFPVEIYEPRAAAGWDAIARRLG